MEFFVVSSIHIRILNGSEPLGETRRATLCPGRHSVQIIKNPYEKELLKKGVPSDKWIVLKGTKWGMSNKAFSKNILPYVNVECVM
ncbi:hypothetical protein ACFL2R_04245 [Patescibacteria group bacterium]